MRRGHSRRYIITIYLCKLKSQGNTIYYVMLLYINIRRCHQIILTFLHKRWFWWRIWDKIFPLMILSPNWVNPRFSVRHWSQVFISLRLRTFFLGSLGVHVKRKFEMRESNFSSEHQRKFVKRESFCRKSAAHRRLLAGSGHQGAMPWPASKIPCVCLPPRGRGKYKYKFKWKHKYKYNYRLKYKHKCI